MRSVAVAIVVLLTSITAARADETRPLCPTWEPCGPSGVRCLYRGRELQASDPDCATAFLQAACDAGSGGGCFELARRDWQRGDHGAGVMARIVSGLVRDAVQPPARLWDGPVPFGIVGLFLVEALAFRLWRRRRPLRAAAWLSAASCVPVAFGLAELDNIEGLALVIACVAVAIVHPLVAPRVLDPPPRRRARVVLGVGASLALALLVIAISVAPPLPPPSVIAEELWRDGTQVFGVAALAWLAMALPKTIAARLFGVPTLRRALATVLLASVASLVPGTVAGLWTGEWLTRGRDALGVIAIFVVAFAVTVLVESWVFRRRATPRPLRVALLSNLCAWLLLAAALFVHARLR